MLMGTLFRHILNLIGIFRGVTIPTELLLS